MNYTIKSVTPSVFRAYDIRGVIGDQLDADVFYTIGKAVSCRLHELKRSICYIARDGRLTSEDLSQALRQGLLESGIDVIDLGAVATPVMYYATCSQQGVDSGLIVTGSHNPANHNGIKIVLAGKTQVNQDIEILYRLVCEKSFQQGIGRLHYQDIIPQYIQRITDDIHLERPLKIVVDCGNGIAGPVAPKVFEQLGCEVISLYCDVDGRFPNHHPDPSIENNLSDLKEAVMEHRADLGLAFDGDADRLGIITEKCEVIWPDRLMMFYVKDLLKKIKGATIVYDVKCSSHLSRVIQESGGVPRMCPTGHSIVKSVMKETNAQLAGEMSGHLFFKDRWYGFDDALYSACRLLEILSKKTQTVSEQFAAIPNSINTPEIKIPISEEQKFVFMNRFQQLASFPDANVITLDGMRVEYPNGWGLIRASNTTPCLVARFEAVDISGLETIKAIFKAQLHKVDGQLHLPF